MEKIYCYKVVQEWIDNKYVSAFAYTQSSILEYSIGNITNPKFGKIFVFQNKKDAVSYTESCGGKQSGLYILLAEVIGTLCKGESQLSDCRNIFFDKYAPLFWTTANNDDGTWASPDIYWWIGHGHNIVRPEEYQGWTAQPPPAGTYFADAIRPVEFVNL